VPVRWSPSEARGKAAKRFVSDAAETAQGDTARLPRRSAYPPNRYLRPRDGNSYKAASFHLTVMRGGYFATDSRCVGVAATVRSPPEILKMRLSVTRYLMTLLCMLAAGTWILPVHTLAAPAPAPLPIMASEVEDDIVTISAIAAELNEWIDSGAFRTGARSDSSVDLDGDGVTDTILASSVDLLGEGGSIAVMDGATGALRFTLGSPIGERGFGSKVALVGDCDADACRDIVVVSGLLRGGEIEIRYRLVSGMSGKLIAVKTDTVRMDASVDADVEQPMSAAGDANHDREIDASDIALAIGELGVPTAARPALDLDCDGQLTVVDVVGVAEKAGTAIQTEDSRFWSLAETQSFHAIVADGDSEGFAGLSWACWARAVGLAVTIGLVITEILACMALCTTPPTPVCVAVAEACVYVIVCTIANAIFKLARFLVECVGGEQLPMGVEVFFELADAFTELCGYGAGAVGILRLIKRGLQQLRDVHRHL
jgi:hypothetical protein